MKNNRTKLSQRVRYALLAGMAGAFLIPQIGFAAPTGEHDMTTGVAVSRSGSTTSIGASAANNVIKWKDYSVASGETVAYDTKNYLNLVTGANTSAINGTITGGGKIYLVNPNGVIFGKTASVNVGSLHVSTQPINTVNTAADMANNVSPLSTSAAGLSDVVNMGSITATNVEVVGKNIRFLNAADVHSSNVVMYTDTANDGTAHIGYRGTAPTSGYTVNGTAATAADNYYQLVANATEFQDINNDLTKNYMLENDIDFAGGSLTPLGNNGSQFTGKVEGNFFKVQNFTAAGGNRVGLFGATNAARIENLGVTGATITGGTSSSDYTGGIVGYATGSKLKNVYVANTTVTGSAGRHGGIAGGTVNTTIDGAYSKAHIGEGGGIIGHSLSGTVVNDTYSDVTTSGTGTYFIYYMQPANGTTINNSYSYGNQFTWSNLTSNITNTFEINRVTGKANLVGSTNQKDAYAVDTYSAWGNAINNTGDPGAKWRIYEGRTAPMLTAFMSGTATANYNYRYFKADGTLDPDSSNAVKSNNGADVTDLTYNSRYVKIVNAAGTGLGDKSDKVIYEGGVDLNKVHDYKNQTTKDFDKTNGIRNAGTKAILWSDQDGPNLRGVNVTIKPREVKLNDANLKVDRMYNGKSSVTDAFKKALQNGGITSSGFTAEDKAANSVQLDFTSGNFQAWAVNGAGNPDKNVGVDKAVKFSGSIGFTGEDAANYKFDNSSVNNITGKITITKAPLYLDIFKKTAAEKIYDGTSTVIDTDMLQSKPNIKLDKSKTAPTIAQMGLGQTIQDGAIMRDDNDAVDSVDLTNVGGPKYTDAAGNEQIHAGNHKLQYTNVGLTGNDAGNYELFYTPDGGSKTAVTNEKVYLDGAIVPRKITRDSFKVYDKTTHAAVTAQKVYDGDSEYSPGSNVYLSTNAGAVGDTGIVSRDQGHITFALTGGKGHFTDNSGTRTKNVKEATKLAYEVTGQTDDAVNHRLSDYYVLDTDNTTRKALSDTFHATGDGKITPKALTATVVNNNITKVYDAMDDQTDGSRHIIKGDSLVTLSGFVGSESRTNTSTAKYASKNVVVDGSGNPTTQGVTYTASFDAGTGAESENYTLGTEGVKPIVSSKTLTDPSYKGTITPRNLTMTFNSVTKVYDGTATNSQKSLASLDDGLSGTVVGADNITTGNFSMTNVTSRYGTGNTEGTFAENVNAGNRTVEYAGLSNALGTANHNYKIADKQYGTGTITRRRIDKGGFRVYNADHTVADAKKVYDGNDRHTLAPGTYLTGTAASGDTGIVTRDYGKVTFALKSGSTGHFSSDEDGNNRTSHVSEAHYVAYDVVARTSDPTNNPLSNYTFGSAAEETAGTLRNLESVNNANPAHVTAHGTITPASIRATTHAVEKAYDGVAEHTDGSRNIKRGSDIVSLAAMITDETDGQPTNTSTARYTDKNVSRDGSGNIINKDVTYTAQLTGQYADDYQIVDAGNTVISTVSGSGANKTLTANAGTVTNAGKITPRKLNIKMGDVSKTYDGTSTNTDSSVTEITDAPQTSVIGTILTGDGITTGALKTAWDNMRSGGTASSSYGNGTGSAFHADANASNGTPHDVRYTKMDEAFKDAFGTTAAGNYTVDKTVYGKGTINRKAIDPNNFDIVDAHGNASHATKVYDGTSNYTVPSGWNLRPSTGHGTGVITADEDKINFAIDPNKGAHFTKADNTTRTANAYEATRVAYNVKATADNGYEYLLKNYTLNGQNLESGNATATGAGTITRRTINVGLAEASGIDKVYDGNANLIDTANRRHQTFADADGRANVGYAAGTTNANKLVRTKNGYGVDDSAQVTVQGSYADKNVARSGGNVTTKSITYNVKIAGDAGKNYYLTDGSTTVNAENGMNLSATGTITPRDLSGAFKKVTKVYDGTKNVPAAQVGFEIGANGVVAGDAVGLASGHTQEFESENVRGSGTTWTAPDGTRQHNWVNYSNLSLTGADAGNYTLSLGATAKGLGEITPFELNPNTVDLAIGTATKTYDGTKTVKWTDGSSALSDQKKYITSATVNINGNAVNVLNDLKLTSAEYDTKDVDNGRFANRVTYNLSYTGTSGNFSLGGASTFAKQGDGVITKKDVTVTVKSPLSKVYDATTDVLGAAKNSANAVVNTANDIIGMTGLVSGDGATNESTAAYADKNAGTGKVVNYDVKLDSANAGNYNLKYNGATITTPISTNNNTITKRKVDVTFAPVTKTYDGTPTNTSITPSVSAADAAVLNTDSTGLVNGSNELTNLSTLNSEYGTRRGGTFTADPNAGTNKDVRYQGLGAQMGTTLGTDAANYEFAADGYGTGTINKANINASDVDFLASNATKTYDGTRTVKHNGSSESNDVKNYITRARVQLNGNWVDLRNDLVMDMTGTQYSSPNATNGTPDTVTYKFYLNNSNINISGDNNFTRTAQGTIDRRKITVDLAEKTGIDKTYDANANLVDTNTRHYDKFVDDDAKGNVIYASGTTNDNKLVRMSNGASVNDGAAMTVTASYADKNVAYSGGNVTTKNIGYNVKIAGAAGQNYQLSDGVTTVNAEDGLDLSATGTISPRTITLGFDNVSKAYDTTAVNNTKNITSVTAGNSDGRGAATLAADGITSASFNTAGVQSFYGAGNTDGTFTQDPNVVSDANGNVIQNGKDVQYKNLANTLGHQSYAGNYTVADTAYGKGTIRKRTVTANDFNFTIGNARKMYDGTKDVVWQEGGQNYTDMAHVKKYFQNSTLDLGGGNTVQINLADISLNRAQYNNENVAHANSVDYDVTINTTNFEFNGTRNRTIHHTGDWIERRDLATLLPQHIVKEYDGQTTFDQNNRDYVNAMAKANLTTVVERDKNKIQLAVTGTYDNKNASANTKAEAEARTPGTAERNVTYTLTLSGDADTLANYTIGGHPTTNTVTGKADIYKKALTVDVARKVKDYDGTAAVNNLGVGDITFSGLVGSETLSLDTPALAKVQGQYLDSNGNADANVSRDANRAVTDKAVKYTGFNDALTDLAGRNSTAQNYIVDGGSKSYTAADAKGRINPRSISAGDVTATFHDATKVYDGNRSVKHNGINSQAAVKNYLRTATARVNGNDIDITNDITIASDEASTHYDNKNVQGGAAHTVTYKLTYTGNNFIVDGVEKTGTGYITRKNVTATVNGPLTKTYDASRDVYDAGDTSIKTYRKDTGTRVTNGDSLVTLNGLVAGDGATNATTARYDNKSVGANKRVDYNVQIDLANRDNYNLVDADGNALTTISTNDNEITKRTLNLKFDDVAKTYDTKSDNASVTARTISDDDTKVLTRDGIHFGTGSDSNKLTDLNGGNIESHYGDGRTAETFVKNANAGSRAVRYQGINRTMRNYLSAGANQNYEIADVAFGDGNIDKAQVNRSNFNFVFYDAVKDYDGTDAVIGRNGSSDIRSLLNTDENSSLHSTVTLNGNTYALPESDVERMTGKYRNGANASTNNPVDYRLELNVDNYTFTDNSVGRYTDSGAGVINRRKLIADTKSIHPTKTYDGTDTLLGVAKDENGNIIHSADGLVRFRHYSDSDTRHYDDEDGIIAQDQPHITHSSTAKYADKNVAWEPNGNTDPNAMWQDRNNVANKDVDYQFRLTGNPLSNYELVDEHGTTIATPSGGLGSTTLNHNARTATGRINPAEIRMKADPKTIWINEGLPPRSSYTGTPQGTYPAPGYPTGVAGEHLAGEFYYDSPDARLRMGDYAVNGYYRPATGEMVYRNYRFVQDPANATALHVGPYIPDAEYYSALTQVSKMIPDEYAYENASLDRRSHFKRDPKAEVSHTPPSVNMVKDGVDISKNGIRVTDETVFSLVNEVFG
ncbi:YDG domain-containing protein [Selenomonas sp. oral taxon 920]|uniref:YDG domain-containing protein n=1 Tax=Selenomonas sp. oral taxon 920 TaxID=1884263 RepID=UPI0009F172DF|nr:YDG domain-containing protein [Selenomonas sp. oral taxon 920]